MASILLIGGSGYVGSAAHLHLKARGHTVTGLDLEWFGDPAGGNALRRDYSTLSADEMSQYDVIILLAGHASVAMVEGDRAGSHLNNVLNFFNLLEACRPDQKLIYASSASIYSGAGANEVSEDWLGFSPNNLYDVQKKHCDNLAHISLGRRRVYGLRFGTVSGYSPNMRTDVVINRMIKDAVTTGRITLRNPHIYRTVLFIEDLCAALAAIIERDGPSGIYNLGSLSTRMDGVAYAVSEFAKVDIRLLGPVPGYDFSMSSEKFCRAFDFTFSTPIEDCLKTLVDSRPQDWPDREPVAPYTPVFSKGAVHD